VIGSAVVRRAAGNAVGEVGTGPAADDVTLPQSLMPSLAVVAGRPPADGLPGR